MFILIYLLTVLTALCIPQSLGNYQKPRVRSKPPAFNKQWQLPLFKQGQGGKYMNYMQRNYTKPKQQPMGDALMSKKSWMNSMQKMRERDMFIRPRDAGNREGSMPAWGVPKAKDRLYTGTNEPTNTEVPAWSMKWSKYIDMPVNIRAGSTKADSGKKMPRTRWSKDIDRSLGNGARVNVDNPGLELQENSARRTNNQDILLSEKSEMPTDELRKTLKNIDEQLAKYENGIYKFFRPNYFHDNAKVEAINKQDLPIDTKVHTLLKTLKTKRKGAVLIPAADEISDISI